MTDRAPVIALDGPSGSGKGTVGQLCARELGWRFLDSGAVYRALACAVRENHTNINNMDQILHKARNMRFECRPAPPDVAEIWVDGRNVSDWVRDEDTGRIASQLAAEPAIRAALLDLQRAARRPPGLVADGRDMGTVVFPDATLKVFLTASVEERAKRRYNQLKIKGFGGSLADLFQAIQERDTRDAERSVSPLAAASDAVVIDSSDLGIDEVVRRILDLVNNRLEVEGIDPDGQQTGPNSLP